MTHNLPALGSLPRANEMLLKQDLHCPLKNGDHFCSQQ